MEEKIAHFYIPGLFLRNNFLLRQFSSHVRYRGPLEPYFLIFGAEGVTSVIVYIKVRSDRCAGDIEAA